MTEETTLWVNLLTARQPRPAVEYVPIGYQTLDNWKCLLNGARKAGGWTGWSAGALLPNAQPPL